MNKNRGYWGGFPPTGFVSTFGISCFLLAFASAHASQVQMDVALANPFLEAGKKNTTYLKVGLTGFAAAGAEERAPVNVALVIDKSGSMSGEKIAQARNAARMAVERLRDDDIVSVVAYDSSVEVIVPATKLTDKEAVLRRIGQLEADGSTALFAGVSKGAAELRKFIARERVNRVILLSDGQANIGPSSPGELGELAESLVKEGISVTTIGLGLGYNEDLMVKLATKSDGNHVFVEHEEQLVAVFNEEFGDILSVVAQEVEIGIDCAEGIRPLRVLGREAEIAGQSVKARLNQLYGGQEKFVVLEIEVPEGAPDATRPVGSVTVTYANMATQTEDKLASSIDVRFAQSADMVAQQVNQEVMVSCVMLIATEKNAFAVQLRDQGKVEEAKKVLGDNVRYLEINAGKLASPELQQYGIINHGDLNAMEGEDWNRQRKAMLFKQTENFTQQKAFPNSSTQMQQALPSQSGTIIIQDPQDSQAPASEKPKVSPDGRILLPAGNPAAPEPKK